MKQQTHYMRLHETPFNNVSTGKQTLETRVNDEKRQQVRVGDRIVFTHRENAERRFTTEVTALFNFGNFHDLFTVFHEPPHYANTFRPREGVMEMRQYYSEKNEKKYGVVGIRVKVIS